MNELERHIEVLLLDNDCVIVPDFGGFVAHHVDAHYDVTDGAFIPPIRTIGFNPQLKINDSLLIHSYIEVYGISYPDALKRVEEAVNELKRQLFEDGYFELNNIGRLSLNVDGNIEFAPNEAGILTPAYYGLCSFDIKQLKSETIEQLPLPPVAEQQFVEKTDSSEEKNKTANILAIDESGDEDGKTISIRVAWIRNTVAIAAAVIAFFLITTPVSNSVGPEMTLSTIQPTLKADSPNAESPKIMPSEEIQPMTDTTAVAVEKVVQENYYVVVLASQVSMANAENFVNILQEEGYKDARIYTHNKVNRVICGHYSTAAEAYEAVNLLHGQEHEEFKQAWVLNIKD